MRCERCGKELTNRIIKINGVTYCDNCARLMGYDRYLGDPADLMGNPFAPLDQIASSLLQMNELDFGNSTLKCPKCGMQGNSEYAGRLPNQYADIGASSQPEIREKLTGTVSEPALSAPKTNAPASKEEKPVEEKKTERGSLTIDQLKKADLGMLSDEDLEKGIKLAAEVEEYILASKLRDELKGRKEGGINA